MSGPIQVRSNTGPSFTQTPSIEAQKRIRSINQPAKVSAVQQKALAAPHTSVSSTSSLNQEDHTIHPIESLTPSTAVITEEIVDNGLPKNGEEWWRKQYGAPPQPSAEASFRSSASRKRAATHMANSTSSNDLRVSTNPATQNPTEKTKDSYKTAQKASLIALCVIAGIGATAFTIATAGIPLLAIGLAILAYRAYRDHKTASKDASEPSTTSERASTSSEMHPAAVENVTVPDHAYTVKIADDLNTELEHLQMQLPFRENLLSENSVSNDSLQLARDQIGQLTTLIQEKQIAIAQFKSLREVTKDTVNVPMENGRSPLQNALEFYSSRHVSPGNQNLPFLIKKFLDMDADETALSELTDKQKDILNAAKGMKIS